MLDFITFMNILGFMSNVALCFICYKYRNVTTVLLYIENIVAILISLNVGEQQFYFQTYFIFITIFICYYTDSGYQIIFGTVCLAIELFVVLPVFHLTPTHWINLVANIFLVSGYFFVAVIFGMFSTFISQMYVHLFASNMQHIKLLNGMHEGVLIIDKNDKSAIFCNRSA